MQLTNGTKIFKVISVFESFSSKASLLRGKIQPNHSEEQFGVKTFDLNLSLAQNLF